MITDHTHAPDASWYPIIRSEEVVSRHVAQAQLLGQEIALWRDDAGRINAWENRCPHRGVRLSIGLNTGNELRCQYHGWRFLTQSGQCSFIPSHPNHKPAAAIRARAYLCTEHYGFVWIHVGDSLTPEKLPGFAGTAFTTLRSIHVNAPLKRVAAYLQGTQGAKGGVSTQIEDATMRLFTADLILDLSAAGGVAKVCVQLLVQPMNDTQTMIHALVAQALLGEDRRTVLQLHNQRLLEIRDAIESAATNELTRTFGESVRA